MQSGNRKAGRRFEQLSGLELAWHSGNLGGMAPIRAQSWAFVLSLGSQALGVAVAGSGVARPLTIGKHEVGRPRHASCAFLFPDCQPQQRRPLPSPHVNSSQAAQAAPRHEIGALLGQKGETLKRENGALRTSFVEKEDQSIALHGGDIGEQ